MTKLKPGEIDCSKDEVLVKQEFHDEVDINAIMRRASSAGVFPAGNGRVPIFLDTTGLGDLREQFEAVELAKAAFNALDAEVRKRFNNDPQEMLAFLDNPANRDEAIKLKLIEENAGKKKASEKVPAASAGTPGSAGTEGK